MANGLTDRGTTPTRRKVPLVELRGVGKHFGGVEALTRVDLRIERGTAHGLVGENGAGKSTLGKIIAGIHQPDSGELLVDGRPAAYRSPHDALRDGLTIIAQELALVPHLSTLDNVFLGSETRRWGMVDRRAMLKRFDELSHHSFQLDPRELVRNLSTAEQQKVEILRALARDARLIVMDEPTTSLTPVEVDQLKEVVADLLVAGTTIVFVSHALEDVLGVCDTVTVLRNGELVRTTAVADTSPTALVRDMIGQDLDLSFPPKRPPSPEAPAALSVRGLTVAGKVVGASFDVRRGEIVALAGLMGSGRTELARAIFGAETVLAGEVTLDGQAQDLRSPRDAIEAGIALLPESRKDDGLVMGRSLTYNTSLPHLDGVTVGGVVLAGPELEGARAALSEVDVRAPSLAVPVTFLSGGNQQKVLFAKWLYRRPRVLLADEPTRGVDVGAKLGIYRLLADLAGEGMAVVLISSELEEILGMAHRVIVMHKGRIVGELDGRTATSEQVLSLAFGPTESREEEATP